MIGPLISVIIPVYNVEKYLERCVDSVLGQTYKSLEILLIDDGSTDCSGEICDQYVKKDQRIHVIHKPNGGLSDARNCGIDHASGNLITFVDSDDFLINDAIECMYRVKCDSGAQIGCCLIRTVTDDSTHVRHTVFRCNDQTIKKEVYSCVTALKMMLQQRDITVSACAKLYDKTLFDNIRYPVGKLYEDVGTTYKLMSKIKNVALSKKDGYCYYIRRTGSIQNAPFAPDKLIELQFTQEQKRFLDCQFPELEIATTDRMMGVCFHILFGMGNETQSYAKEREMILGLIRENRKKMALGRDVSFKVRIGCFVSYFGLRFTKKIYDVFSIRGKLLS